VPVAIEVQKSKLSVDEITRRTKKYHDLGIYVLWLALHNSNLSDDKYSPSAWERWCHATYFGRVYYWLTDLTVLPIHFSAHQLYAEETTWYEAGGTKEQKAVIFDHLNAIKCQLQVSA
tara:strand:- start:607 stop:960 length:354 start_codon:yes stop_codon:yes gene_type:complete